MPLKPIDPYRLHLLRVILSSTASSLIWVSYSVYAITVVGMSPFQLVIVGTALEVAIFLGEIPTGIVADLYSRRLSVLIGTAVVGFGYLTMTIPAFAAIFLGHIVWGLGWTFISGAYDAWLVDEIGIERAGAAFLRGEQFATLGAAIGIVGSALLALISLRTPVIAGATLYLLLALLLALTMAEHGFKPAERAERSTFGKVRAQFMDGLAQVRTRPALLRILGVALFFGLFSEAWDRLWQAHLLQTFRIGTLTIFAPVTIFAGLNLITLAFSVTGAEVLRRRLDTTNLPRLTRTILLLTVVMVAALALFGIAPHIAVALFAFFAFTVARQLVGPLLSAWTNGHITSSQVRATVLSMGGQMDAIGQTAGGPPLGAIGTYSLRAAFVASATLLTPALPLLYGARKATAEPLSEAAPVAAP